MSNSTSKTSSLPLLKRYRSSSSLPRRYRLCLIALPLILFSILTAAHWNTLILRTPLRVFDSRPRPPSFAEFSREEEKLLQQNPNLASPEGENAKFLFSSNHITGSGWGNVLQEMIWDATLAYMTKRAYVFDDYIWQRNVKYSDYNGQLIPSKIPAFALLSGPLVGLTLQHEPGISRAVSRAYYEKQCSQRFVIRTEDTLASIPVNASGMTRLAAWAKRINEHTDKCIELSRDSPPPSNHLVFASSALLDVWPTYSSSPMIANFTYSPLVLSAFQQNARLLFSQPERIRMKTIHVLTPSEIIESLLLPQKGTPPPSSAPPTKTSRPYQFPDGKLRPSISIDLYPTPYYSINTQSRPEPSDTTLAALSFTPPSPIPGLLAMHIRRGDYDLHCENLLQLELGFTAFNSFEGLPDKWSTAFPARYDMNREYNATAERRAYHTKRCYPTIEQIVGKVRKVKEEYEAGGRSLSRIYIMTNGTPDWIAELKKALYEGTGEGWETGGIVSSRDMEWGWEQQFVSQATDMYIGQRADVFIGNGFSTLSAHVVMMRMMDGKANMTTRHW